MQSVSYGSFRPFDKEERDDTPEASAHNRRVDIVVLPYKESVRSSDESGFGMPGTKLPQSESLIKD